MLHTRVGPYDPRAAMSAPPTLPVPPRRRAAYLLGGLAVALVALVVAARAVVGHLAASALAEHDLTCAPVAIDPWPGLDGVDVAATACRLEGARLASVTLPYGASVALGEGWRPRAAHVPEVTAELAAPRDLGGVGDAILDGAVPAPLAEALAALAAASGGAEISLVELDVARVRSAGVTLELRGITLERDAAGTRARVRELTLPLHHGPLVDLDVRVEAIEVRASRAEVSVEGRLRLDARLVSRELDAIVPFHVTGTGLDAGAARWALRLETSLDLGDVRARVAALRARREHAPGGAPLERIGAMADRLDALRERVEASSGDEESGGGDEESGGGDEESGGGGEASGGGEARPEAATARAPGTTAPAPPAPTRVPPLDPATAGP